MTSADPVARESVPSVMTPADPQPAVAVNGATNTSPPTPSDPPTTTAPAPSHPHTLPLASPAALAYFTANPRRPQVYFGNYLLLQTLGEGEFGKVKLGVHRKYGEEVAIKLIKREKVAASAQEEGTDESKMSKVEREIHILKLLKHPNIVHLYEVIESERYIGIVLEYGAGGELFDYILAHKCLKERDACRLFAQLVSGVSYLHRKKIIHRDLKLENLLLDRNRNVMITDFGFANNFSARENDLMATSCGSPCYAAPELVVQDGLYVGAAVDVWSCGVILYAMLAGYLPFDDDPANPEGDNINMLYKYIMSTPLTFPDYIGAEPRSLLLRMLVPDPTKRATLDEVMAHPWLAPYRDIFQFPVEELENAAIEQQAKKRQAYRDQMEEQQALLEHTWPTSNTTTAMPASASHATNLSMSSSTSSWQPNVAAAASPLASPVPSPPIPVSATAPSVPKAALTTPPKPTAAAPMPTRSTDATPPMPAAVPTSSSMPMAAAPTLTPPTTTTTTTTVSKRKSETDDTNKRAGKPRTLSNELTATVLAPPQRRISKERRVESKLAPPLTIPTTSMTMLAPISVPIPMQHTTASPRKEGPSSFGQEPLSLTSFLPQRRQESRSRKTSVSKPEPTETAATPQPTSVDAPPVPAPASAPAPAPASVPAPDADAAPVSDLDGTSTLAPPLVFPWHNSSYELANEAMVLPRLTQDEHPTRRATKPKMERVRPVSMPVPPREVETMPTTTTTSPRMASATSTVPPPRTSLDTALDRRAKEPAHNSKPSEGPSVVWSHTEPRQPSTQTEQHAKASWWRRLSGRHTPMAKPAMATTHEEASEATGTTASAMTAAAAAALASSQDEEKRRVRPKSMDVERGMRTDDASRAEQLRLARERLEGAPRRVSMHVPPTSAPLPSNTGMETRLYWERRLKVHVGAVDQAALTTRRPDELFAELVQVLQHMGLAMRPTPKYEFRVECMRPKRLNKLERFVSSQRQETSRRRWSRMTPKSSGSAGSTATPRVSTSRDEVEGDMARLSLSSAATTSLPMSNTAQSLEQAAFTAAQSPPLFGESHEDGGHEVRLSIELTRLVKLQGLYSVDIRRMKGNIWSYKFLYDQILERLNLGGRVYVTPS